MWTIAAVNKKFEGPLGSYNGLTDVHLAHFFSQPSRKSHLKAAKLITEDGFIVPEKNVKGEIHFYEKKRKVYDILARSILQNAVHEEGSWNKKLCNYLEDISKMAAVDKARRTIKKKSNRVASELLLDYPFSYNLSYEKDILRSSSKSSKTSRNLLKSPNSAPVTCVCFSKEGQQKIPKLKRSLSAKQYSPYGVPLILSGSYKEQMQSLFDSSKTISQKKKSRKIANYFENLNIKKNNVFSNSYIKSSVPYQALKLSQCEITMLYHGHLRLINFQKALTQNIVVKQQHCGGTPVIIYKGKISSNEFFSFFILDHEGFFFSLIVFLNGIRELKLSSCCVFRYLPGRRLGGPNGTFSIKKIEGGKPCLKCQYQEYESNESKVISESSRTSSDTPVNVKCSHDLQNDFENEFRNKASLENYKQPNLGESNIQLNNESHKMIDTENQADDEIEEMLNEGVSQCIKEEAFPESCIIDARNVSLCENEIKENEDSESSVSSIDQSEISEKYASNEQNVYHSVDTSSEEEGENHHIVTASIHKIPEDI